jgi:bifunctional non-homologous end joining protein LigD
MRRAQGGIQYVEHSEGDGAEMFAAICKFGLEGIVSKKINAPYRSGRTKNPKRRHSYESSMARRN